MTTNLSIPTRDNLHLYAKTWEPESAPRAAVCLVHGLGEHCGRYAHLAAAFNAAGIAMLGFDLRGHGQSPGLRGHTPAYATMLDDINSALQVTRARFPNLPLFLYGHSMGGNLVINHALRRKPPVAGAIATSPWLRLTNDPPALQMTAARLMNRLLPKMTQPNGLELEALSRDPQVIAAYQSDPLVHNRISVRLAVEFTAAGKWVLEHAAELALPLLLAHGSADRLTSPKASREFAAKAGQRCTLKIWDGLYHETHNEPEKAQVIAYNLDWIEQVLANAQNA